jgi:hypothetical protein
MSGTGAQGAEPERTRPEGAIPDGFVLLALGDHPFVDSIGPLYGHAGEGVDGRHDVLRATRNLVFCQGLCRLDGVPRSPFGDRPRVDGIARPIGESTPGHSARRYFG